LQAISQNNRNYFRFPLAGKIRQKKEKITIAISSKYYILLYMNRETQRHITRLEKVRDAIVAFPSRYRQSEPERCILGIAATVQKLKGKPVTYNNIVSGAIFDLACKDEGKWLGLNQIDTDHIYTNQWLKWGMGDLGGWDSRTSDEAVQLLNKLIEEKRNA
jgi:hypothetical protein